MIKSSRELITVINEIGKYFSVEIFDDYVIKTPKHKKFVDNPKLVKFIVDVQNEISKVVKGVLPCKLLESGKIKMSRATGWRVDKYKLYKFRTKNRKPLNDFEEKVKIQVSNDLRIIKEHGYLLEDLRDANLFYDEEKDLLQYVDFSNVKKISTTV